MQLTVPPVTAVETLNSPEVSSQEFKVAFELTLGISPSRKVRLKGKAVLAPTLLRRPSRSAQRVTVPAFESLCSPPAATTCSSAALNVISLGEN